MASALAGGFGILIVLIYLAIMAFFIYAAYSIVKSLGSMAKSFAQIAEKFDRMPLQAASKQNDMAVASPKKEEA